MKDADSRTLWVLYHTGCWHAWQAGFGRSVCGLIGGPATKGRVQDVRRRPPDRKVCRVCRRRMAQAHSEMHRDGPGCACQPCRAERRRKARESVREVRTEVRRTTCPCIRRRVRSGKPPWDTLGPAVERAERILSSRLLVWEVTGEAEAQGEAEAARHELLGRWCAAARRYEVLDLRHRCRKGRP